jgi:anaerobic C4-dicarboxylate transporter
MALTLFLVSCLVNGQAANKNERTKALVCMGLAMGPQRLNF